MMAPTHKKFTMKLYKLSESFTGVKTHSSHINPNEEQRNIVFALEFTDRLNLI